jgi:hypothetical protein
VEPVVCILDDLKFNESAKILGDCVSALRTIFAVPLGGNLFHLLINSLDLSHLRWGIPVPFDIRDAISEYISQGAVTTNGSLGKSLRTKEMIKIILNSSALPCMTALEWYYGIVDSLEIDHMNGLVDHILSTITIDAFSSCVINPEQQKKIQQEAVRSFAASLIN